MGNLITEVEESYEKKIAILQGQIEQLRAKKEMIISSLREDIGDQEIKPTGSFPTKKLIFPKESKPEKEITTRDRVLLALDKMPTSGFGTAELFESMIDDINIGIIKTNRIYKILQELTGDGIVRVIKPRHGKEGGTYQKVTKEAPK